MYRRWKLLFDKSDFKKFLMCPLIKRFGQAFVSKAWPRVWKTRPCVCVITRPMLSQSAMVSNTELISTNVTTKDSKEEKELGITFANKLDFSTHRTSITKKADIKLNALTRIQKYMTPGKKNILSCNIPTILMHLTLSCFNVPTLNKQINK